MKGRRADTRLHLELLRARAAASRVELSEARQQIADRLRRFGRAADAVGTVANVLIGRAGTLGWLATAVAVLGRARWARRALAGAAAGRWAGAPTLQVAALAALATGLIALVRRARKSAEPASKSAARGHGETD
jgi:hypothetical protein